MKPFVIKKHEKDFAERRLLEEDELALIAGGAIANGSTVTVTPNGDGGNDGSDGH